MRIYVGIASSWSLRALIMVEIAQLDVEIQTIDLTDKESKKKLSVLSPTGLVPFLQHNSLIVNDSLSILEYLYEIGNDCLYPKESAQRALARSLCAEIHSGFLAIRQEMPFLTGSSAPSVIPSPSAVNELQRIESLFSDARLPFFWGKEPTAVDAFYAVMALRLQLYGIYFSKSAGSYQQSLLGWESLQKSLVKITPVMA